MSLKIDNYMKLIASFCLILFLFSVGCTPEFDSNKRILVTGIVLDSEGQGISGSQVNVYTKRSSGFLYAFGQDEYLLGSGTTSLDGSFNITSLSDRDNDFAITVDGGQDYSNYVYATETQDFSPTNLTFDIGNVNLLNKAVVDFSIARVSGSSNSISYSFSYQNPECFEVYEEGVLNQDLSDCYSERITGGASNENNPDMDGQLITTLGSVVTFNYSINEEPEVSETFTVDQVNFTYDFTY